MRKALVAYSASIFWHDKTCLNIINILKLTNNEI